jgi:hypothetical protein
LPVRLDAEEWSLVVERINKTNLKGVHVYALHMGSAMLQVTGSEVVGAWAMRTGPAVQPFEMMLMQENARNRALFRATIEPRRTGLAFVIAQIQVTNKAEREQWLSVRDIRLSGKRALPRNPLMVRMDGQVFEAPTKTLRPIIQREVGQGGMIAYRRAKSDENPVDSQVLRSALQVGGAAFHRMLAEMETSLPEKNVFTEGHHVVIVPSIDPSCMVAVLIDDDQAYKVPVEKNYNLIFPPGETHQFKCLFVVPEGFQTVKFHFPTIEVRELRVEQETNGRSKGRQ